MKQGPIKHVGSLRRRAEQSGLTFLGVLHHPVQHTRLRLPSRPLTPSVSLRAIVLLVVCYGLTMLVSWSTSRVPSRSLIAPPLLPAQPAVVPVVYRDLTGVATDQNIEQLAQILMSEASPEVATHVEASAVGYTVLNRMKVRGTQMVHDVWDAYAHHATPTDTVRALAGQILRKEINDPSHGATHFYSPRSMPMEGDAINGFDTGGGLEQTPGLSKQNYRPGWATQYTAVVIEGTRASYYKFYRQPGSAVRE